MSRRTAVRLAGWTAALLGITAAALYGGFRLADLADFNMVSI
ncbi:MAG: hypothetical protein U5N53_11125 [Mycobacterium sp.]|nr:hypothetical protein [Mycobacterium sp.]